MHDMEADLMIDRLLEVAEPGNVDQRIGQDPCVTIALYKLFDFIHPLASGTFYVRIQEYTQPSSSSGGDKYHSPAQVEEYAKFHFINLEILAP